jgi:deoxyribodipyrimidine photolyase
MSVSKLLNIYIPRMLGTINKQIVIDTFHSLHIGCVNYIDMHKRVNENNNSYYFAFITLELYDTDSARYIKKILNQEGITRITYDTKNKQYWEVKQHIHRELRVKEKEKENDYDVYGSEMVTIPRSFEMTNLTKEEFHQEFYKDLNELLKEANLVCFGQQHYIDYYCN